MPSLTSVFHLVARIVQPQACIVVGVGYDMMLLAKKEKAQTFYFIDADTEKIERYRHLADMKRIGGFFTSLIGKEGAETTFYIFSNSKINTSANPSFYKELFPHAVLKKSVQYQTESLHAFIEKQRIEGRVAVVFNTVDTPRCLQSLEIPDRVEALFFKLWKKEAKLLERFMTEKDYKYVSRIPTDHPEIEWRVYVRDRAKTDIAYKKAYESLQKKYDDAVKRYRKKNAKLKQKLKKMEKRRRDEKESKTCESDQERAKRICEKIDGHSDFLRNDQNYFIKPGYRSRTQYTHFNDQENKDEWQLEVYLHALGLMKKNNLTKVVDIGCGSGYKLVHYLGEYDTVGLELEANLDFLKTTYPDRTWLLSDFAQNYNLACDVLICSDVIEHLVDPDELIAFIKRIEFKFLVISTPDRDLVYEKNSPYRNGPPRNPAHVREWTFDEFGDYMRYHFDVLDHRVTNLHQSTQMVICKKREETD